MAASTEGELTQLLDASEEQPLSPTRTSPDADATSGQSLRTGPPLDFAGFHSRARRTLLFSAALGAVGLLLLRTPLRKDVEPGLQTGPTRLSSGTRQRGQVIRYDGLVPLNQDEESHHVYVLGDSDDERINGDQPFDGHQSGGSLIPAHAQHSSTSHEQLHNMHSCENYGCGGSFMRDRPCQCNQGCSDFNDCCHDYTKKCEREDAGDSHSGDSGDVSKETPSSTAGNDKDHECHTVTPKKGDECWDEIFWAMTDGIHGHPDWYKGLTKRSTLEEFQAKVHHETPDKCPRPCPGKTEAAKALAASEVPQPEECVPKKNPSQCESPRIMAHRGASSPQAECLCPPPLVPDKNTTCNNCQHETEPESITFYMYRAQDTSSYPMQNVNMADLAGTLWYLHREVISSTPRKFKISRILRYSVTIKPTKDYFKKHQKVFGPFVAFDSGSARGRSYIWKKYGFIVGCQMLDTKLFNYVPDETVLASCTDEERDSKPPCAAPSWYSLPGPCPEEKMPDKNAACSAEAPGGMCPSAVVSGEKDCTYFAAPAGEISLNELEGIVDYKDFWQSKNAMGDWLPNGNVEYSFKTDAGIGMDFWDGRHDKANCTRRIEKVLDLFKEKYPTLPRSLPQPPCT